MEEERSLKTSIYLMYGIMLLSIILALLAYNNMATEYLNTMTLQNGILAMTTILVMGTLAIIHYRLRLSNLVKKDEQ